MVLPKNYASHDLNKRVFGNVVDLFTNMGNTEERKDFIGRTYECCIQQFYVYYNAICIISDQLTSKAGTITSGEDCSMEWKTKDSNYENIQYTQFDTFFERIFKKEKLLDIIKNFICFSNEDINSLKIFAGYHQYFATRQAIEFTKHSTITEYKGGVFGHTKERQQT